MNRGEKAGHHVKRTSVKSIRKVIKKKLICDKSNKSVSVIKRKPLQRNFVLFNRVRVANQHIQFFFLIGLISS